jgi:hypothetical protein
MVVPVGVPGREHREEQLCARRERRNGLGESDATDD